MSDNNLAAHDAAQHVRDITALREKGFSNLSKAQQNRLLSYDSAPLPTAPTAPLFKEGDLVGLESDLGSPKYRGITFKVDKVNPKTYILAPLNGGVKVRAQKVLVTPPPVTTTKAGTAQDVPLADPIKHLVCGTIVRVHNNRSGQAFLNNGDLGVVLVDKGERVNVAPLGGFEDRYGRLPRRSVTVVDPKSLIEKPF